MKLWKEKELDILTLTETWQRPTERIHIPLKYESITLPPTGTRRRGNGGVAILINHKYDLTVTDKHADKYIQYIAVRVEGLVITAIYASPGTQVRHLRKTLNTIRYRGRGRALIMGDLNARHHNWCTRTNPRGTEIDRWSLKFNWNIIAANEPTFCNRQGRSNIDIALIKSASGARKPEPLKGDWDGSSDHTPVMLEEDGSISKISTTQRWIPWQKRRDPEVAEESARIAAEELPQLTQEARRARTATEMENVYRKYTELISAPYVALRKTRPGRYKPFWNRDLDNLAKQRSRLYRKAKLTNLEKDWKAHNKVNKEIKQKVDKEKRQRFKKFAEDLPNRPASEQQRTINRIQTSKKKLTSTQTSTGCELDRKEYTYHIADRTKSVSPVEYTQRAFVPHEDMEELLKEITRKLPNGKAPGEDLIVAEALKSHPTNHAELLNEFWALCGRVKATPKIWTHSIIAPIHKRGDQHIPENHSPISLLCQPRKVIEAVLANLLRREYKFEEEQAGFQSLKGTEIALLRCMESVAHGNTIAAVLDMKLAYDRVCRQKVIQTHTEREIPGRHNKRERARRR